MGVISDKQFRNEFRLCSSSNLTDEEIDFIWNSMLGKVPLYKLELLVSLKENTICIFLVIQTLYTGIDILEQFLVIMD